MPLADAAPLARMFAPLHRRGLSHPFVYYTVPLLAVALAIAAGSLAPPEQLPNIVSSFSDKILHGSAYALFGFLLLRGWTREEAPTRGLFLRCGVIAIGFGFYLEILQSFTPERTFDLYDVLANAIGTSVGLMIWMARHRLRFAPAAPRPALGTTAQTIGTK